MPSVRGLNKRDPQHLVQHGAANDQDATGAAPSRQVRAVTCCLCRKCAFRPAWALDKIATSRRTWWPTGNASQIGVTHMNRFFATLTIAVLTGILGAGHVAATGAEAHHPKVVAAPCIDCWRLIHQ